MIDELLCYISCKLNLMTCDALVSLCVNSFTDTAIVASKLCLFNACQRGPNDPAPTTGIKYQRRRGNSSMENDVRDIITLFQEMGASAPKFAALDLNALPSPATNDIDVSSLVQAIELLRKEVASLNSVVTKQQEAIRTQQESIRTLQTAVEKPRMTYAASVSPDSPQNSEGASTHPVVTPRPLERPLERDKPPPKKPRKKFNVGQKAPNADAPNARMLGIKRVKTAELFITRLSKDCDADAIHGYILANLNLDATVEKIDNSARNVNFSSFHISCVCDDPKVFYDPKLWPEHVLYRRWYPPRQPRAVLSGSAHPVHP